MIINTNIAALNTLNQLSKNDKAANNALAQLSSGQRINSAADDAAGLAISQKMQGQINGLDQASRNAQDGISLVQTADGALSETTSILQRMRELAVQSGNDTNTAQDRSQMQKEVDQLSQEITSIGNDTQFNTQNLLDGSFKGTFQVGANQDQNLKLSIGDMRSFALGVAGDAQIQESGTMTEGTAGSGSYTNTIVSGTYTVQTDSTVSGQFDLVNSSGVTVATSTSGLTFTAVSGATGTGATVDSLTFTDAVTQGTVTVGAVSGTTASATGTADHVQSGTYGLEAGNYTVTGSGSDFSIVDQNGNAVAKSTDSGSTFQSVTDSNKTLLSMGAASLFTSGATINVGGIDISTQDAANKALTTLDKAINQVDTQRAQLGAYQNRLDHTINNLDTSSQNLSSAKSGITDVDMAKEMSIYTKDSILQQAAQSMLAKANQAPQNVLQLLR